MVSLASLVSLISMTIGSVVVVVLSPLTLEVVTAFLVPKYSLGSLVVLVAVISTVFGNNDNGGGGGAVGIEYMTQASKEDSMGNVTET